MYEFEPKIKGKDIILIVGIIGIMIAMLFGYYLQYSTEPVVEKIVETVIVEQVSEEGEAKAIMIRAMTGYDFPPEVAKWANVNISGTTVSIETHSINLWDGKKWR